MHDLLDQLYTRWGGGQALRDAICWGELLTRPESLQNGPSQLLLDFYSALPDHQIYIQWELMALSQAQFQAEYPRSYGFIWSLT